MSRTNKYGGGIAVFSVFLFFQTWWDFNLLFCWYFGYHAHSYSFHLTKNVFLKKKNKNKKYVNKPFLLSLSLSHPDCNVIQQLPTMATPSTEPIPFFHGRRLRALFPFPRFPWLKYCWDFDNGYENIIGINFLIQCPTIFVKELFNEMSVWVVYFNASVFLWDFERIKNLTPSLLI